ncbi:M15 family metallopeptidase [Aneurinibacillus sp. REN35]|uniref:M15 family metallopeptidase n=1 Tax=Aneurinibacillus sp. REN35 TaxID=3237286 RepID=UPI0035273CE4
MRYKKKWPAMLLLPALMLSACQAIPESTPPAATSQNANEAQTPLTASAQSTPASSEQQQAKTLQPKPENKPASSTVSSRNTEQHTKPAKQATHSSSDKIIVTNAASVMVLVNKKRNLPENYEPADLVVPNVPFSFAGNHPKKQLRRSAARALEELFAQAKREKIDLKAVSGYRSYATQKAIFTRNAKQKGEAAANRTSAYPGQSEHQTGLAMDISSASVGYALEQRLGKTKEGKWLAKNAHRFGFILRYPKEKEAITGYSYEPWHIRYVGKEAAKEIVRRGITLEEYFNQAIPVSGKTK